MLTEKASIDHKPTVCYTKRHMPGIGMAAHYTTSNRARRHQNVSCTAKRCI